MDCLTCQFVIVCKEGYAAKCPQYMEHDEKYYIQGECNRLGPFENYKQVRETAQSLDVLFHVVNARGDIVPFEVWSYEG